MSLFDRLIDADFDADPFFNRRRNVHNSFENAMSIRNLFDLGQPMSLFNSIDRMKNDPNTHVYTSSMVYSSTVDENGRPQATSSMRQAPGGIKETRKAVADTRTGTKHMSIGHHIKDKGHIRTMGQDIKSGRIEEQQEFINMDEEDEPTFRNDWDRKTQSLRKGLSSVSGRSHRNPPVPRQYAIEAAPTAHAKLNPLHKLTGKGKRSKCRGRYETHM